MDKKQCRGGSGRSFGEALPVITLSWRPSLACALLIIPRHLFQQTYLFLPTLGSLRQRHIEMYKEPWGNVGSNRTKENNIICANKWTMLFISCCGFTKKYAVILLQMTMQWNQFCFPLTFIFKRQRKS